MLAWVDDEALQATRQTGEAHFHSRSRDELWHKGATSGNTMEVVTLDLDCDADTLLMRVLPRGPACHTGSETCFGARLPIPAPGVLAELAAVIEERRTAARRRLVRRRDPGGRPRAGRAQGRRGGGRGAARGRGQRCAWSARSPTCGSTPCCSWPATGSTRSRRWRSCGGAATSSLDPVLTDYHMHLVDDDLPYTDESFTIAHMLRYVDTAAHRGVAEIGFTDHVYRFTVAHDWLDEPLWQNDGVNDLGRYHVAVQAAQDAGLPVKVGLEVDYLRVRRTALPVW